MAAPIVVSAAPCGKYWNCETWLLMHAASTLVSALVCSRCVSFYMQNKIIEDCFEIREVSGNFD